MYCAGTSHRCVLFKLHVIGWGCYMYHVFCMFNLLQRCGIQSQDTSRGCRRPRCSGATSRMRPWSVLQTGATTAIITEAPYYLLCLRSPWKEVVLVTPAFNCWIIFILMSPYLIHRWHWQLCMTTTSKLPPSWRIWYSLTIVRLPNCILLAVMTVSVFLPCSAAVHASVYWVLGVHFGQLSWRVKSGELLLW